ncbi:ABC transporter, substrate-binding protein, family 5 [Apilactobacillus kunkeei]|uniref:peptide ABC transporter substrate-binding protein n=1 Tax=Apilactobacillus kunkeei TaxID=148814 RepID=UPI0006C6C670|nr:peptide ABC transporter substrate-binding protein [Apilactobacillus kunkeei]KOY73358.1 ABC transporter, substrate-binding protein, family 5 [Apilactobacillus kunkeei]
MKKLLLATAMTALAGVTLAACGNNSGSNDAKTQTLNLAATSQLSTLDISTSTGYGSTGNAFSSFYKLGDDGKPTLDLAQSANTSKDGKTWTFKLRDAKWSNGKDITANDFVYSWRRTVKPATKAEYSYLFNDIENGEAITNGKMNPDKLGIKALNKHTVQIKLTKPIAYFKTLMAYPLFGPQDQATVKKYGDKYGTNAKYMVYSGPFSIEGWNGTNDTWSYVKNNNYWDAKDIRLKKINYTVVANPTTSLNLYNQGKIDVTALSSEQLKNYKNNSELHDYSYSMTTFLRYNFNDPDEQNRKIINNKNIRKAISLAIDRDQLNESILGFNTKKITGFVPYGLASDPKTGKDFADQQGDKDSLAYNKKLAKQYYEKGLKELGIKNVSLSLMASTDDANTPVATQYLKAQLESVLPGFTLNLRTIPGKLANDNLTKGNFEISLSSWGGDFKDPITFLQIPEQNTPYNFGKYNDTKFNALLKKAGTTDANDASKRWQDLIYASKELNDDQGISPLYQVRTYYLQKSYVKDVIHNTAGPQWNYTKTFIKK